MRMGESAKKIQHQKYGNFGEGSSVCINLRVKVIMSGDLHNIFLVRCK